MNKDNNDAHFRYCGRIFAEQEVEWIRQLIASNPKKNRARLSRVVCEKLDWVRPDGRSKEMSCRVAMLRMERDGLITLPPPQRKNSNGNNQIHLTKASEPQAHFSCSLRELGEIKFHHVQRRKGSSLWNELIKRYHYLGYKPLPGAQIRYLVYGGSHLLAALGFGAAAWTVAPRDQFIGWSSDQRKSKLHLVVNNARFLILPWIDVRNLASCLLADVAKRLPSDWQRLYGYQPVLLETFVQKDRFRGTCYRAANWIHVGETKGRGKLDRKCQYALPVKDIFLYPLHKRFRQMLCSLQ